MARDEMARDLDSDSDSLLDRRSYLKLAGAAAASVAATGAATTANAASYETIKVPAGSSRTFEVGDGETFENKLIDISAEGASAYIQATSNNFTIRNVGFKGTHPGDEFPVMVSVPDASATGTVENLYLGDGSIEGSYSGGIFVQYSPEHNGTLRLKNVHIAHFSNNGLYGSAPGHRGQQGITHVEDSFFYSNNIANIRLGNDTELNYVRNCTVKVDGTTPACDANCSSPGAVRNRGVWAWTGRVELENCDIQGDLETMEGGEITQTSTKVGSSADTTPPAGTPMSAEEAASGGGSGSGGSSGSDGSSGSGSDGSTSDGSDSSGSGDSSGSDGSTTDSSQPSGRLLELISGQDTDAEPFEFTVEGSVTKATADVQHPAGYTDTVTDNGDGTVTVSGTAGQGTGDSFWVDGSVTAMNVTGSNWTIRFDGSEVSVAELTGSSSGSDGSDSSGSGDSSGSTSLPNTILVDGTEHPRRLSSYEFSVTGDIRKDGTRGSINARDNVSGSDAAGRVISGKDAYRFSGEITHFRLQGSAVVEVRDGSQ
ncbi:MULTISPECIES: hypothetical protein [Halorussus]|uniref:hypothetical protein n=1 Tax=Halorussus TaxID=1070314 RepID=UPI00209FD280|nr:hypothetical protein [Halorussus vallis]USZ76541.1 hypothetical protein NGM07_04245 [Halorussus vallis]